MSALIWLNFVAPVATVIAAGFAAYVANKFGTIQADIGKQQAATAGAAAAVARNKLQLDLHDRRMAIVEGMYAMLGAIISKGKLTQEDEGAYLRAIQGARWLFSPEFAKYLDKTVWHLMIEFDRYEAELDGMERSPERTSLIQKQSAARKSIMEQREVFEALVDQYMVMAP